MKELFLIIDYQVDFVADDGALTAGKPAQAIEPAIAAEIERCRSGRIDILATQDTHRESSWQDTHPESRQFPIHCEHGSAGWQLYGRLADLNLNTLVKTSYMMAAGDIDRIVQTYDKITLAGVTMDICVFQNAIGLYNHAANIGKLVEFSVRSDCVASFDPDGHQYALAYMKDKLGFSIIGA